MTWHLVDHQPLRIEGRWPTAGAGVVADALKLYAVPILRATGTRLVPQATGSLFAVERSLYLVTAAHAIERIGDLRLPLAHGRLLHLEDAIDDVRCDDVRDIAVLRLGRGVHRRVLVRWRAYGLAAIAPMRAELYAVCGYPVAQSRWHEGALHSKPVTFYTRAIEPGPLLAFGRIATRSDAADVFTPPLEGVSGAAVWALVEPPEIAPAVRVAPAGIQISYRHGDYVRCADWHCVADLVDARSAHAVRARIDIGAVS